MSFQNHPSTSIGPELHKSKEPGHQSREKGAQGAGLLCTRQAPTQGSYISGFSPLIFHFVAQYVITNMFLFFLNSLDRFYLSEIERQDKEHN